MRLFKRYQIVTASLLAATCLATSANAADINAITTNNQIVTVNSASPSTILRTTTITGLGAGQTIVAFDARPASGGRIFYGLSNTGQLYSINPRTGAASAIGAPIALQGTAFGFDFNPTVDRIRIVSNSGQNLRVNPETGATIVDGPLNIVVAGRPIRVMGHTTAAYTNNFAGATSTTLYVINTQTGLLEIVTQPNSGTLQTVGGLGGTASGTVSGFDISITGENRVSIIQNGVTNVFSINLQTGAATLIGQFGTGLLQGLAYSPVAFADEAGLSTNQRNVGGAFDNFTSVGPGFVSLLTTLDRLPDAAARADAFTQLGPISFSILPETILQTNEFVDGTVQSYLRDSRQGGTPAGAVTLDTERAIGAFLVGSGRTGDFRARGERSEVDYGATGVIGGIDVRLAPRTLVGVTGGYDRGEVRLNAISPNSRAKTWFIGGYGTLGLGPAFLDLVGSYGKSDISLRRNVAFADFASNNRAETDARHYSLSATAGISQALVMLELEPYVGVRYADVRIDRFSEGTGLTNLNVGRQDAESLQGVAGLRAGANFRHRSATIRPSVRAEYRREFENDEARVIDASFAGSGINSQFTTTTTPLGDDYLVVGAGLTIAGDSPVGVVMEYTGQFMGGYNIHGGQIGIRIRL